MATCPSCGEENLERARFCSACGAALRQPETGPTRKTVTVVFCDVVGSTALAERLDPETLGPVMVRYFAAMREVLERHGGAVEKYIGDAVMAVFGHPRLHEDDPLRAVRAAQEMREVLTRLNDELERRFRVRIETRTGVNTGEIVAAAPSGQESLPLGDAANVAARFEQAAGPGEILIGDGTYRLVSDAVVAEPVEPLALKGKGQPVPAWRLLQVVPGMAGRVRRLDSPMVGRQEELGRLLEAFARAVRDRGVQIATVVGEPGLGKSRLTAEFLSSVGGRARVLRGRCLSYGEGITWWPVTEVVKEAAGIDDADTVQDADGKLGALVDGLDDGTLIHDRIAGLLGLSEASWTIQESFWAVRRLLENLAAERPLVVLFDDIHWGQPTFLDLLEYVSRFIEGRPVMVLCAARPDLRDIRPAWEANGTVVRLVPLDEEQSARLVDNLLNRATLSPEVHARISAAAEGNPLFVEEMLRMLIDDGLLRRDDGHWVPSGDLSEVSAPRTIAALLAARLDRLQHEERAVIQRASVVGKVFWWGAVADLSPEEARSGLGSHLQTLLRREFILPERSNFAGEDAFRFGHILVRDAAYDSIPKRTRADLHERFASWLERTVGGRLGEYEEILGYHLERAYRYRAELGGEDADSRSLASRAGQHLASAGRKAFDHSDLPATASLLSRAAALLERHEPLRRLILPPLGSALFEVGRMAEADAVLSEAIEAARLVGDESTELIAQGRRAYVQLLMHPDLTDFDEATRLAERSIERLEAIDDHDGLSEMWWVVGVTRFWGGHGAEGVGALEQSMAHARLSGNRRKESEGLHWLAVAMLWGPVPADEALSWLEAMSPRAAEEPYLQMNHDRLRAQFVALMGDFEEARRRIGRAKDLTETMGFDVDLAETLRASGFIEILAGRPSAAEAELRRSYRLFEGMGSQGNLSGVAVDLAEAILMQGRAEEALELTQTSERVGAPNDPDSAIAWRRIRARVLAGRGEFEEAERLAREAVELASETDFLNFQGQALRDLAEVLLLSGRADEARVRLRESLDAFERKGNVVSAARVREALRDG
jgi:class 3 adenylate cyclase/tetratricopeptide (TPR) repeat protein